MSEEILKALMQLFALIAKQDEGAESNEIEYVKNFLVQQLSEDKVNEYFGFFEEYAGLTDKESEKKKGKLTSVRDSVKILGICKKINKTLSQNQKVIVLVRLFELVNADRKFSDQRMAIINTVAEVFNISDEEIKSVENFVKNNDPEKIKDENILVINDKKDQTEKHKHIQTEKLDADIFILRITSVDLYFLKYTGSEELYLNGLSINNRRIYLFASGSTVKLPKGKPVYYSDIAARYLADLSAQKISYEIKNIEYTFPNGNIGLRNISFAEDQGKLIGIMGASGAGKTTLLTVLSGITKPSKGEVLINGVNLHEEKDKIEGVIGLIPQDDLLIEELTVFENLYYSAKLCFKDKPDEEIKQLVDKTLTSLGLFEKKHLKVGSPLNKTISGGQRKRLNIALELIREPSILFVDEPTSGLSSNDSENVMDLLRELTLKGKLIFVVIHQPSSDIYKMFDKMVILDTGGYLIYYGNPVEAVMYFKRLDMQINSDVGECPVCGNVNPELIFNIIEAKVVDEYGKYTNERKITPTKWENHFLEEIKYDKVETIKENPPRSLSIPNWFKQGNIFFIRDLKSKIANTQYIALNMLEAPLLGVILSYIIRYIADPNSNNYIFRENENIPIYIFMSLIVALFLGLMVSAEEIFKDRKVLKREAFLNLSRSSYLVSKISILFIISAIQAFSFVVIGNTILGIKGMYFPYWLALFSTAAMSNMLGLNISATFNSAVTIYIIIPLLMIPMMVLSGAMFPFDKLNRSVGSVDKVPVIAEVMVTKWAYEAMMVKQFKDNRFEKNIYQFEKDESFNNFKIVYYIPELNKRIKKISEDLADNQMINSTKNEIALLKNEFSYQLKEYPHLTFTKLEQLHPDSMNFDIIDHARAFVENMDNMFRSAFDIANKKKENFISAALEKNEAAYNKWKNDYHNESVSDQVKKVFEKNKILEYNNRLVQQIDPIYLDPRVTNPFSFRSHFYAPRKYFFGTFFDTFAFNIFFIWFLTLILYITLYFELLKKLFNLSGKIKFKK